MIKGSAIKGLFSSKSRASAGSGPPASTHVDAAEAGWAAAPPPEASISAARASRRRPFPAPGPPSTATTRPAQTPTKPQPHPQPPSPYKGCQDEVWGEGRAVVLVCDCPRAGELGAEG